MDKIVIQLPISTLDNILVAVARGDELSFRRLFNRYKQKVYTYAMHFSGSASISEEIVQEVFLKIWLGREKLPEIARFEAYLYTIIRNLCFDYLKKAAREETLRRKLERASKPSCEDVESAVIYNNYQYLLRKALERLPPQQKRIYMLSFYEGRRQEDIAHYLHISIHTVKVHLSKARSFVRSYVAAHIDVVIWVLISLLCQLD